MFNQMFSQRHLVYGFEISFVTDVVISMIQDT